MNINNLSAKTARRSINICARRISASTQKFFTIFLLGLFLYLCGIQIINAAEKIVIASPPGSMAFGSSVTALPNGNIVVADSDYANSAGAVYLYRGSDGALISTLKGSASNDRISNFGVVVLPNGNYLLISPNWHGDVGAVTFCNKSTGCSGFVSAANSLIGSNGGDLVGYYGINVLSNGNYVVSSPRWGGYRGAVTWGSGQMGVIGAVSDANSLIGAVQSDRVGTGSNNSNGVTALGNGNYVVVSSSWNDNRGAATFCDGSNPCAGTISASNSLVGTKPLDSVGRRGIAELANNNYVVRSNSWSNDTTTDVGAVTWGNGITGVRGVVSSSNSIVGSTANEQLNGVTPLTNGNYVVLGPRSATFGNGTTGTSGAISAANSLMGTAGDDFYSSSIVALTNGNYVVICPGWDLNASTPSVGAVTLGNGTTGTIGVISPANSLVGDEINNSIGGDGVTPLSNGNYVVSSGFWHSSRGAVTFGNGVTGVTGTVTAANSLVGTIPGDGIGDDSVTALANGNYVVSSSDWNNGTLFSAGAVTFGDGTTGISGAVSSANSLVGSHSRDEVGNIGVLALPNGNYVVSSLQWNEYRGAATFGSGMTGVVGEVSAQNSLVGSNQNDYIGATKLLANGNYVVFSQNWNNTRGSATFGNGLTGISGEVSPLNSLVGSMPNDRISSGNNLNGITALPNGNYVVQSPSWMNGPGQNWANGFGAVTFGNGTTGTVGYVSRTNSLVGTRQSDSIGSGDIFNQAGITVLPNNMYVIFSPLWDNNSTVDAGAITIGKGNIPITGEIIEENSVAGTAQNWGSLLKFSYDSFNNQIVVGDRGSSKVTLFRFEDTQTPFDFDGDGKTDISIFRPSAGEWWYLRSSDSSNRAFQFGASTDKVVAADYTGDGKTDIAFWRESTGEWFILRSEDSSFYSFPFGASGDIPTPADFDGDGKSDPAVFRPSNGTWYIIRSSDGGVTISQFGANGDQPVAADYDGDSKADLAIFRPSDGSWWLNRSSAGLIVTSFGSSSDKTVPADYTGDGRADVAFWRPSTGEWFILRSEDFSFYSFPFGAIGDTPTPGDYDGDGRADPAVFRNSNSSWYLLRSTSGFTAFGFGQAGDTPVPSAYTR